LKLESYGWQAVFHRFFVNKSAFYRDKTLYYKQENVIQAIDYIEIFKLSAF